jgi:hypothetical protein
MKGIIKGVLREELNNSLRMKRRYAEELSKIAKWCLVRKRIKGHYYFYLAQRKGGKVLYRYRGRILPAEVEKYKAIQAKRANYRKSLRQLDKQIKFLRSALRGKQPV